MDFSLTTEQKAIKKESFDLAQSLSQEDLDQRDHTSSFAAKNWKRLFTSSIVKGFIPKSAGGRGWSVFEKVIALESFGYGCRDNGLALALSSLVWTIIPPVFNFGSARQQQDLVASILSGDTLYADGITEAEAGSDAMAMQTTATRVADGYLVNGEKVHIGFAPIASRVLLFAKTDPDAGSWGVSVFLIDLDLPGISRSTNREKCGLRTLPSGAITFRDCHIPTSSLVGDEGAGLAIFNESMEYERGFILASQIGSMARQLDTCIHHSRTRKQFGKPISQFQSVSNRIADMKLRLESSRLHLYRAAWLKDQGEPCSLEASLTKLIISESFFASSSDAIRLHGANGYLSGSDSERDLRDATGGLIYAGTSDIQRNLIARLCGL